MPLNLPTTANEVVQRSKTDVQRELAESNPFLKNSWLGALVTSLANRIFDFYIQLKEAILLSFPDTTSGTFLDRWASIYGTPRLAATQSSGNIAATGTATTIIPISTNYQSSDGIAYSTTAAATITAQSLSITSLVRVGSLVTATTSVDHNLASNVPVVISGAVETEYNGDQEITVTGLDTFEYTIATTPSTPATGTVLAGFTATNVPIQSTDFGADTNQSLDAILTLQSPIAGVDNDAQVNFGELDGGVDQENDDDLRVRLLSRIQNPVAHFSEADIDAQAKEIAGVTRVFVQSITPAKGQVTVYFMRDDETPAIPDASEVAAVKTQLDLILPANTSTSDLIVAAPTAVPTAFTFSALSPNTSTMQTAITASLNQFFDEETEVGVNIDQDKYRAAIINTIDTETGDTVSTFTLSTPSGDITIASGEIGTLGTITYP